MYSLTKLVILIVVVFIMLAFEPKTSEAELPEWIIDLADDLDVLIAQRHFEDANSLISKAKQYLEDHSDQISTLIEQEIKFVSNYLYIILHLKNS